MEGYPSNGHRWSTDEIKELMIMWHKDSPIEEIANRFDITKRAVCKQVTRLRSLGIPLKARKRGHVAGNTNKPWTQSEIEYVIRRRKELCTVEQIGNELDRTWNAVNAIIQLLRKESVGVQMLGSGKRRLWNPEDIKASMSVF